MAPLHAAPPPSSACSSSSAVGPAFLARPHHHHHRRAVAASCCSPAVTAAAAPSRKAFLSCPDHSPGRALAPPRITPSSSPALVASVKDLYDFICSGPLVDRIGYTKEKIAESIDRWLRWGGQIARLFRLNELQLSEAEKVRIYHFYIPVFLWCEDQVIEHRAKYKEGDDIPPLVIGVSAPQGSGKTTLVFALNYLFRVAGRNSTTLSIDDFYLTAKEQNELRDRNPGNALLELRGNAGSHDLQFSVETLESLTKLTKEGMKMKVPRYDKSAFGGRGDRADPSVWPEVEGPLEVILFEGWMLGFKPLPNEVVKAVDPQLEVVNKNLEAYYNAWDRFIESWIVIKIREPNCVFQWRLQAEIAMRADGKPGMSNEEVMDFVSRYLPAYHAYLPTLYKEGPNGSKPEQLLVIDIDEGRNPLWGN
ncbi:D-glycerate 3-kinase, chloroplastic-like isoform X1 [Panicum miliaceum]|uniref:D-glycerate 3-kinase, chloroplastic-like isoform X1 n=1 Tax=Panicum miliaceum TaxID=4540 RepID=A0A3L6R302_PANMI|nr:D-glycerate 3-kinase, chloroplastic-like isoform X1 [Panicum miliaceum]